MNFKNRRIMLSEKSVYKAIIVKLYSLNISEMTKLYIYGKQIRGYKRLRMEWK